MSLPNAVGYRSIVIAGVTGTIGSEIFRTLICENYHQPITLLIRPKRGQSANDRYESLIRHFRRFFVVEDSQLAQVTVISCDFSQNSEGLREVDGELFINCVASTDIAASLSAARKANVDTTKAIVKTACSMTHLKKFVHFSTAYVNGYSTGLVHEDHEPKKFNNGYEQSKYESEQVVKTSNLPFVILRPSMVVGNSRSGYFKGVKIVYSILRIWQTGHLKVAPLPSRGTIDIVPIDFVIKACFSLAVSQKAEGGVFHLCAGHNAPRSREVFSYARLVYQLAEPFYIPLWVARLFATRFFRPFIGHALRQIVDLAKSHLPYLGSHRKIFDMAKTASLLEPKGIYCPHLSEYGENIFRFCLETNWGKRPMILGPAQEPVRLSRREHCV